MPNRDRRVNLFSIENVDQVLREEGREVGSRVAWARGPAISDNIWDDESVASLLEERHLILPAGRGAGEAVEEKQHRFASLGRGMIVVIGQASGDLDIFVERLVHRGEEASSKIMPFYIMDAAYGPARYRCRYGGRCEAGPRLSQALVGLGSSQHNNRMNSSAEPELREDRSLEVILRSSTRLKATDESSSRQRRRRSSQRQSPKP